MAILAGGVFALMVSAPGDASPLAADPSPTPTGPVQEPSPTPSPAPTVALSATPAPTPESTAPPAPPSNTEAWIGPERIATRDYGELSLVVDDAGIAHAAAELDDAIYYLTNATGSWTREQLSQPPAGGHDGDPAIAIDRDGSLAVAFVRYRGWDCNIACLPANPDGIYSVTNATGAWPQPSRLPIDVGADPHGWSVKVFDGALHVVYGRLEERYSVWHAHNSNGDWRSERVVENGGWSSFEMASDGTARIAFVMDDGLYYARQTSQQGSFAIDQASSAQVGWPSPLLALDGSGQAHIAYLAEDAGSVYTRWGDGAWSAPEAVFPGVDGLDHRCEDRGSSPAVGLVGLGVSDRGTVHLISENDVIFAGLWYSTDRGGRFEPLHLRLPDPWDHDYCNVADLAPTRPAAIAIDRLGRPHILFVTASELWYAIGPGD